MSTLNAMYRSILENPDDDLPRLLWADYMEPWNAARSEFVRVQVELARADLSLCTFPNTICNVNTFQQWAHASNCPVGVLRRRERELIGEHGVKWSASTASALGCEKWGNSGITGGPGVANREWQWSRGFVSHVRLSWQDWLSHHEALYWHPKQTVECPKCEGEGEIVDLKGLDNSSWAATRAEFTDKCRLCKGTGRIPRPFVTTAQPLSEVQLTTWPLGRSQNQGTVSITTDNGIKIIHGRCQTCDGSGWTKPTRTYIYDGVTISQSRCPACHGEPLNEWHCETWTGIRFKMPVVD